MKETQMLALGQVGVIPTDTLYGLVASTANQQAVERVYSLKGRTMTKPCIILISSLNDLSRFNLTLTGIQREAVSQYWPGPISIVFSCDSSTPTYLHRGTHTLAFRVPRDTKLQKFLKESGPLVAPSANPQGLAPATTIEKAKEYFGDAVDFYIDGGERTGPASTLLALDSHGSVTILRKGK